MQVPVVSSALVARALECTSSALPAPVLPGAEILAYNVAHVNNYSVPASISLGGRGSAVEGLNFCNVSITYTHPGQQDTIKTQIWLPDVWNERFLGNGGGGWTGGYFDPSLAWAISEGYSAGSTDGGHSSSTPASEWGLLSPGNVNLYNLQNLASVSLNDMASLGKSLSASYYGKSPNYSYWNGCSQGGRQGMMMAQRYPDVYQGILAVAPAINWNTFIPSIYWPQVIMNTLKFYPRACELKAFTAAAVQACDNIDGVVDGIISLPTLCRFDPFTLVGQNFSCDGTPTTYSHAAAEVVNATWTGPATVDGKSVWPGLPRDASLLAHSNTTCASNGTCTGLPFIVSADWIQSFLMKNSSFELTSITPEQFPEIVDASIDQFQSIIGTENPDLSGFRDAGGKLLTFHGIADEYIPYQGTAWYHDRVKAVDAGVDNYFRHFEAPGFAHCSGGEGAYPSGALQSLVDWVEKDRPPNILEAKTQQARTDGKIWERDLCLYPSISVYQGGDPSIASSYACV
ncbi:Tannase/feruloyl esterase [Cadophora sp. MPI-SDFR-AT-0126]|nr:Tannase/feruloyl esterase [Leotiomycetes sp. MPI-SDFR-AT-0126]